MPEQSSSKKMFYLPASTWWMRILWPSYTWHMGTTEKKLYLTFDDGPDPEATAFVLNELKKYNAKGTFFCIGENVRKNQKLYRRILDDGHATGNHTHRHPNGWKTPNLRYLDDVKEAAQCIDSGLFRPPYGRIRQAQYRRLAEAIGKDKVNVIMWSVLSADFDISKNGEQCFGFVRRYAKPGSIVVFHDSARAFPNLSVALPRTLEYFTNQGYEFERIQEI
jgi:peptidoglycan/xylan/chitin deacetylase (PgdA/CDA1 family)